MLLALTLSVSVMPDTAAADNGWTQKQETAHQIAELARSIDLPEDNPVIVEAKRLWQEDSTPDTEKNSPSYTEDDAVMIAKIIYAEAGGIPSDTEKACVAWVILNRVDAGYGDTIAEVATAPYQFAYRTSTPVRDDLLSLSRDVLGRWDREKRGGNDVGRVLPADYLWFTGDGLHNNFRRSYSGGRRWDYSLPSPYTT